MTVAKIRSLGPGSPFIPLIADINSVKLDSTSSTYTPILTDQNIMVLLAWTAPISVQLPKNSTTAFPIGAEIDFVWWGGAGSQVTFIPEGGGATVVGTPGLKLRAQYSAATAKKLSTNGWIVIGDLSA